MDIILFLVFYIEREVTLVRDGATSVGALSCSHARHLDSPFSLALAHSISLSLSLLLSLVYGKLHTMDVYKQLTRNVAAIWFTSCITGLRRV